MLGVRVPPALLFSGDRNVQSTQRFVIFAYLAFGVLIWATIAKLGGQIAYTAGLPDPAILGDQFTLTTVLGLVLALGAGIYGFKNERAHTYANEVVAELMKCTWPGKKETRTATVVVIVTSLIIALILGLFDAVWAQLTGLIYRTPTT
jgi:preprotein translocase subunit SecE